MSQIPLVPHKLFVPALAAAAVVAGCASRVIPPVHPPLQEAAVRRTVVVVPGITGSVLRDRTTGEVAWGIGKRVFAPHDGAYGIALSLNGEDAGADLEAHAVIEEMTVLGIVKKEVYGLTVRLLAANGYQRGELSDPRPGDRLFLFAYDWRQSNEVAIKRLADELEGVRRAQGSERLQVDLICQSNGGHICRYLAKYGAASFADAEAGRPGPDLRLDVSRIVLVGTSNGGSLRILREIDRGRTYFPVLGRKMQPEALFTMPALFQDLPGYLDTYFLDEEGEKLDVDLYDPAAWEECGWSIFGAKARKRAARRPDLFGGPDEWRAHLTAALAEARQLQRLLRRDAPGFGATRYYLIQNASDPTPERAVLAKKDGAWKMLLTGDKELARRPQLLERASTLGDGHAAVESQLWLAPQEEAAIAAEPFHVTGEHFELIHNPESLQRLLEFLSDGDEPPPPP